MIIKCTEKEKEKIINNDKLCVSELIPNCGECIINTDCIKCKERNIKFEIVEDKENE